MMRVSDVMTAHPETLEPGDLVEDAARLMRDGDYGVVPVVEGGRLIGIVTDRDIVIRAVAEGLGAGTAVQEIMTERPDSVPRDASLEQAAAVMSARQIRRLPVVEYGRLIGMLSLADLANGQAGERTEARTLEGVSRGPGREMSEPPLPHKISRAP